MTENTYDACVQWDVLSHGNPVQEVSRIPNGSHPGNCISLLRVRKEASIAPGITVWKGRARVYVPMEQKKNVIRDVCFL